MDFTLRLVYPGLFFIAFILVLAALVLRILWYKPLLYRYSLASYLDMQGHTSTHPYKKILFVTRMIILFLLSFLLGKPQLIDYQQSVVVQGIDIILALDISGSMRFNDIPGDRRSRLEVAKAEALRFVKKREHDAIGLVFFAADTISRAPLTLDKNMLKQMIEEVDIGTPLNPDGTLLATSIVTAANRLKMSQAKSKVIILLTDGAPSEGDIEPHVAVALAKQLGIKIYTIGIGSDQPTPLELDPFFRMFSSGPAINKELLGSIAKETGGRSFIARNAQDMRDIYNTIDNLEKTELELPLFNRYYDIFMPFVYGALVLVLWELFASGIMWFSI